MHTTGSQPNSIKLHTAPKPDYYYGSELHPDPNVWLWLVMMELQFAMKPDMSDHDKLNLAVLYLRGDALVWWHKCQLLSTPDARLDTWDKFSEAIKKQFGGINPADKAREGLAHLKQTGTVAKYISQFDSYCLQIPQQDMTDPEVKQRFMDGLKPEIAYRVRLQFPKSCREAMALAEQVDLVQPVVASSSASSAASQPSQPEQGPEPMELCAMTQQSKHSRRQGARYDWPPLTDMQKDYIRKHEGCTYCRRCFCGHTVVDCPDKLNNKKGRVHMD